MFACCMMKQATSSGTIPEEIFDKKKNHCSKAYMTKTLFTNSSRILHWLEDYSELDVGDYYNRMAHTPTSLALQSWDVPVKPVCVLLKALQITKWCLHTGFGESNSN